MRRRNSILRMAHPASATRHAQRARCMDPSRPGRLMAGPCRSSTGFTLLEVMLALSITAIAGTAMVTSVASSLDVTEATIEEATALGLAQQLMDEISCLPYYEGSTPYQYPLGYGTGENIGNTRLGFDDMDDLQGLSQQPPRDVNGLLVGRESGNGGTLERHAEFCLPTNYFSNWRWTVAINYVSNLNQNSVLAAGYASDYRAYVVTVQVNDPGHGWRTVTSLRRVFAYVPTP